MPGKSRSSGNSRKDNPAQPSPQPGTVTAVTSQVKDPQRVNVFIDGAFSFGLDRTVAETSGIVVGTVLDASALSILLAEEERSRAINAALAFLAWRPRSEGEIRRKLHQKAFPDATIDQVVQQLRDWHYVDDEDFAKRWVENRVTHRPRGTRLLVQELRSKGIENDMARAIVDEAGVDEYAGALEIARKRSSQLADLEPAIRTRRLTGYLGRRGYGFDTIRKVLEALGEEEVDSEPTI